MIKDYYKKDTHHLTVDVSQPAAIEVINQGKELPEHTVNYAGWPQKWIPYEKKRSWIISFPVNECLAAIQ